MCVYYGGVFADKPVIGITGGIGSGKSFIASLFAESGCVVINSDQQVAAAYREPEVIAALRRWWGDQAIGADGEVNRSFIASKVFNDVTERRRLEGLLHPRVNAARERMMREAVRTNPELMAFVWDTPLLFEAGLNRLCDAVVFVDAPQELRQQRVAEKRGWDAAELARRENSQWPLDSKAEMSDYVVSNTADAGFARTQVQDVLSRIFQSTRRM